MPTSGTYDLSYLTKLKRIGIEIIGEYKGAKAHHPLKCTQCGHCWEATPISKVANYNKHGSAGCPKCTDLQKYGHVREQNIQKLIDRGLEILSDWDGTTGNLKKSVSVAVTVRNTKCGHSFTSSSKNLLTRDVSCPICAKELKTKNLNASSKSRSEKWALSAPEWKRYRSEVTKLTKLSYKQHKSSINPNNLPTGKAGTDGAYHLDHIVPVRYCFDNHIPAEICAHWSNLQMLEWRDNVGSRDKLKEGIELPEIFHQYIS